MTVPSIADAALVDTRVAMRTAILLIAIGLAGALVASCGSKLATCSSSATASGAQITIPDGLINETAENSRGSMALLFAA